MPTINIAGQLKEPPGRPPIARSLPNGVFTPKHSVRLDAGRAEQQTHALTNVASDDLVELELTDGIRLWTRADDLERDFGVATRAGGEPGAFTLPAALPIGGASRGVLGEWALKALRVFGVDIPGGITEFVADKVEGQLRSGPGLFRCSLSSPDGLEDVGALDGTTPTLVFLHGTASSTQGSFGGLWEGQGIPRVHSLFDEHAGQVLAFQHRTLTLSPIENALDLVKALADRLPDGARLRLVSHSRGGLVGELLCRGMLHGRGPFVAEELELFKGRPRDEAALEALGDLLAAKQFQIERFVRVGCPARGTSLADHRLDRYLSMILNVLQWLPGLGQSPLFDAFSSLLVAVVKKRAQPEELPGLEAQMPGSPLVRVLNRPDVECRADLHVLGGDLAGSGIWGRLKTLATDLFFREDHDLVVNTASMLGGVPRTAGVRYWIDTGARVNHFSYFRNADTASRLVSALLQPDAAPFHRLEEQPASITEADYRKRAIVEPRPLVFVLPGIMGSHLRVKKNRVWLDYVDLALGGLADLDIDAGAVEPDGLVAGAYRDLVRFLAETHEVIPVAYDWRRSVWDGARTLQAQIEDRIADAERTAQPVRIVAHSMGGLVVRAMLAAEEGARLWTRMCKHPGARVVMLGTPNGGSHAIGALLIGRDALSRKLALLDLRHSHASLLRIIADFDGVLDLLPDVPEKGIDLFDPERWREIRQHDLEVTRGLFSAEAASDQSARIEWPTPDAERLAKARERRGLLQKTKLDPARFIYVAGVAPETPCDITIDASAPAGRRVVVHATPRGDGRVPWDTGIPAELRGGAYYMDALHGDLVNHADAFPALLDLMTAGATSKLSRTPPVPRALVSDRFVWRGEPTDIYPDEDDLVAAALGGRRRRRTAAPAPKTKVRVVHGNLSRASSPVLVGHYTGDTIVGAEDYLDRQLGGRLRELHRLGLYPGPIESNAVVLGDESGAPGAHPGAIVVGLGQVGELTPGKLAESVSRAGRQYGEQKIEGVRARQRAAGDAPETPVTVDAPLTTLLVGTGAGGITVADSLQSILRGVRDANERLTALRTRGDGDGGDASPTGPLAFISRVDFVELYEDRAIQAVKALIQIGQSAEIRTHFSSEERLVAGAEGRRRAHYDEEPGWWQRMRIEGSRDGRLKFEALTERARAEAFLQATQKPLVDSFLEKARRSSATDPALCYALFDLLVPNPLKEYAPDRRNLVLVLDERSAEYPWELLHDRFDTGARPLAVEAGLIRQLVQLDVRRRVVQATQPSALVIGDPTSDDASGRFPALPGAVREASEVAKLLRAQDYDVTALVGAAADPQSVVTALYARRYRVIHLAAHGIFEPAKDDPCEGTEWAKPTLAGVVLAKGMYLTPAEFEQMRFVPELVFINCCHLGQIRGERDPVQYNRLAANVATQFIKMGVRAVVAAGWEVNDEAARTFAETFYEGMLQGQPFGDTVKRAREEIYGRFGGTNTWGAYQCYGDPDFSLGRDRGDRAGSRETGIVAEAELRAEVENVAQRAKSASPSQRPGLLRWLEALVGAATPAWLESGATSASLAEAFGELGEFERAVRYYERASHCEPATARLRAMEQFANLKARWAEERARTATAIDKKAEAREEAEAPRPEQLLKEAEALAEQLLGIGKTFERSVIKGSVHKRRAMVVKARRQRQTALARMADAYDDAYALATEGRRSDAYYPLLNRVAAEISLSWHEGRADRRGRIDNGLKALEEYAKRAPAQSTDFWALALPADAQLLRCCAQQQVDEASAERIIAGYRDAERRGGSPRELRSVVEHVRFLAEMARTGPGAKRRTPLVAALERIVKALES